MAFKLLGDIIRWRVSARINTRIKKYLASGCKPWSVGYKEHKEVFLRNVLRDEDLLNRFLHNEVLPARYGFRIDERVIEYPWILCRLSMAEHLMLDAGSALNFQYILEFPAMKSRNVIIYNLAPESVVSRTNVSYVYGDLRHTILKTECLDEIICISTLEHIGMDNSLLYSKDPRLNEFKPNDYKQAIREFKRLLKPGGQLFITVPYGRYENLGWLQQFDCGMVKTVFDIFEASNSEVGYYRYFANGWQVVDAEECVGCSYFDIHKSDYESDYAAAARAVVCIKMVK